MRDEEIGRKGKRKEEREVIEKRIKDIRGRKRGG